MVVGLEREIPSGRRSYSQRSTPQSSHGPPPGLKVGGGGGAVMRVEISSLRSREIE